MGNLHDGHLALVRQARELGDLTVADVFVNRLQFLPHEDFNIHPRTLPADAVKLASADCNVLFAPSEHELYPEPQAFRVVPDPAVADILEGGFRPGFFTGVCTVVMKLFQCVQPHVAVFGKKDTISNSWCSAAWCGSLRCSPRPWPASPVGQPTDSRSRHATAICGHGEREEAVQLSRSLLQMAHHVRSGMRFEDAEVQATQWLRGRGWQPDYLTVRSRSDLLAPNPGDQLVALGAARLGNPRLIDNREF